MDLSAIIKAVPASRAERSGQTPFNLQPGDRLAGKVLQIESDGRVLIDLGESRVLARMGFAVQQGQTLKLTVVESGPLLHLRADLPTADLRQPMAFQANPAAALTADERRELIQTIEHLIPRLALQGARSDMTRSMANALQRIETVFDPLPMEKSAVEIAQWLRNALENHGGFFEKRLADIDKGVAMPRMSGGTPTVHEPETSVRVIITRDLKPQLIILKHFLEGGDASPAEELKLPAKQTALLRSSVEKMLHHVEQQQERAVARFGEGEPFQLLHHLLPMAQGQPPVRLKVYYPRKDGQGGSGASHRISLLLDMDRLGLVRGDIAKQADGLKVRFFVQDEGVGNYFKAQLGRIESALKGSFEQVRVDVSVSREAIARFHDEDIQVAASGLIDIKA